MLHYFLHGWCCTMYSQQESSANNNFQFYQQLAIIIQQYNVQILNSRRESPESIAKGYQSSYRQSDKRMTLAPPKLLMQLRFVCCLASKSQIKMIDFNGICFQSLFEGMIKMTKVYIFIFRFLPLRRFSPNKLYPKNLLKLDLQ